MAKTKLDIIDEVVKHYKTNPRSFSKDEGGSVSCLYNGPNGSCCAFALYCDNPESLTEKTCARDLLENGFAMLKEDVAHIVDGKFWNNIQNLHDVPHFWQVSEDGKGSALTSYGRNAVEGLKEEYK